MWDTSEVEAGVVAPTPRFASERSMTTNKPKRLQDTEFPERFSPTGLSSLGQKEQRVKQTENGSIGTASSISHQGGGV